MNRMRTQRKHYTPPLHPERSADDGMRPIRTHFFFVRRPEKERALSESRTRAARKVELRRSGTASEEGGRPQIAPAGRPVCGLPPSPVLAILYLSPARTDLG